MRDIDARTCPDLGSSFPLSGREELKAVWGYILLFGFYRSGAITPTGEVSSSTLSSLLEVSSLNTFFEAVPLR